ncbi:ParB/RepB/Spo0J family partition protein [Sphingosinicella sp. BN140058]|uniref:ParB/RepB/Spo0J family partition protein n=1 Tax=Sphingosinicella sp. BN140058 TaxID=1892855 RepID=UPI0010112197|nr:ParB/RepB/Spo0J family partition protein [Sphingosinicella sp. BN140058]QAY80459.1 ParB/RepB/Spo0J family partition protein [Sphingosinicella sp. BN140058]
MSVRRRSLLDDAIDQIGSTHPAPTDSPPRAAAPKEGTDFLTRRGAAFDEIVRTVKTPTIKLKPDECSIWPGNARDYEALTYDRCETLVESIIKEGRNREPAVVRRTPGAEKPYELIVGTRRHWSIAWCHANHHSEIDLVVRIEQLDDEAAFRLADIENREREDVSDLERARNYKNAIETFYGGVRQKMADRLAIPKQRLHELLQLAEIPDVIVGAYASPMHIKVHHAGKLLPLLRAHTTQLLLEHEAGRLTEEQAARRDASQPPIEAPQVLARLIAATVPKRGRPAKRPPLATTSGVAVGTLVSNHPTKGLVLKVMPGEPLSVDEILEALRPAIADAKFKKRSA